MRVSQTHLLFAAAILLSGALTFAQSGNSLQKGMIAFEHRSGSAGQAANDVDVYSVNADGTNVKALTQDHHSHAPSWSPDGKLILYVHNSILQTAPYSVRPGAHNTGHPVELYVMDRDGANAHLLQRLEPMISSAEWSPDGKTLAVSFNGGLYLLPADGFGEPHLLFSYVSGAAWSPDGRRLAFSVLAHNAQSEAGKPEGNPEPLYWAVHITNTDGSMESQVSDPMLMAQTPAWSPDGKQIAFSGTKEGSAGAGKEQIFVMNQDGSDVRQLTDDPHWEACWHPSWSPDGRQIAFSCFASPPNCSNATVSASAPAAGGTAPCTRRIFVVSADGAASKLMPIVDEDGLNPSFSPK